MYLLLSLMSHADRFMRLVCAWLIAARKKGP